MRTKLVIPALLTLLVSACGSPAAQQLPEPAEPPRSEELADGRVRFWPRSAPVEQAVTYAITVYTHCGLDYLFDLDTSFWELAAGPDHSHLGDPDDEGLVRLVSPTEAIYTSSLDGEFRLIRTEGPRVVHLCE